MKKYILAIIALVALIAFIRTNHGTSAIAHSPRPLTAVTAPKGMQKKTEKPEVITLELSNISLNFNPTRS